VLVNKWSIVLIVLALVVMFVMRTVGKANPAEVRELVKNGAKLLDVRTPQEFAAGHIEGALNVPVHELPSRLTAAGPDKSAPVVVYCRSGARSARAAGMLKEAGYTRVYDLGAMSRW
jgi:phage shock protein E